MIKSNWVPSQYSEYPGSKTVWAILATKNRSENNKEGILKYMLLSQRVLIYVTQVTYPVGKTAQTIK